MYTKDVNARSPLRVLERSMRGGLGRKNVGVVLARSGVGKTACLVQIALDALLRGLRVLHVSNEAPVDHLRSYYDELFHELERSTGLLEASAVLLEMERRRLLISQPGPNLHIAKLTEAAAIAKGALGADPDVIIVEGFDLSVASDADVAALRDLAGRLDAELWLSVRTHRHLPITHPKGYPSPVDRLESNIDVMIALESLDTRIRLRVIKDHDAPEAPQQALLLDSVTLQLIEEDQPAGTAAARNRARFTLHSGGARGAEATFGEMAERYGIREVTFSFEGHMNRVRSRGLRVLSENELRVGDVSLRYVSQRLGRIFPQHPSVRSVIQSIWHQVKPCNQIFVVGIIQPDGTVRGGTGWGAELARRWKKEVYVFDQVQDHWFRWDGEQWAQAEPVITSPFFVGTGTANLQPNGQKAIESLFERSFGPQEQA
jgi:hypothetical protein